MNASLFGVSSQDYIRLLESGNLAFFSQFTCFLCGNRLWRNGYRQRHYPVSIRLLRLKCRNSRCNMHYTAYPSDVPPRYRHNLETVVKLTSDCLNSSSNIEQALRNYQHDRETRIEEDIEAGPDISTLRHWLRKLSDPASILSLFLLAHKKLLMSESRLLMVVFLVAPLATQLLTRSFAAHGDLSPIVPVTDSLNQVNCGMSSQNDLNFYNQEHPP